MKTVTVEILLNMLGVERENLAPDFVDDPANVALLARPVCATRPDAAALRMPVNDDELAPITGWELHGEAIALRVAPDPTRATLVAQQADLIASQGAELARCRALLLRVLDCVNAHDCEHPDFRDSCADVCALLDALAGDLKAALAPATT